MWLLTTRSRVRAPDDPPHFQIWEELGSFPRLTQGATAPEVTASDNVQVTNTDVGGEAMIPTVTNPTFYKETGMLHMPSLCTGEPTVANGG